jgi:anti-anti-sigma factor
MSKPDGLDPDALVPVRLIGLPVSVHRRTAQHYDAVRRELVVVDVDPAAPPSRLDALSEELNVRYAGFTITQNQALAAALDRGDRSIDLEYRFPASMADDSERIDRLLDEVDDYCRAGDLLTLVAPPELLAYRQWILAEIREQIRAGRSPVPWPEAAPDLWPEPPVEAKTGAPEVIAVDYDLDLAGAGQFRTAAVAAMERGHVHLVVDLVGCGFADSTGLSMLLTTRARCIDGGGTFVLTNVGAAVRRSLEYAGVVEFLERDGTEPAEAAD